MKNQAYVVGFMVALAAVFGAGVTGIQLVSQPTLDRNAAYMAQQAVVDVFGLGDPEELSKAEVDRIYRERIDRSETCTDPQTGWSFQLIKAYADATRSELLACGFRFTGAGFWGPIESILALDASGTRTIGLRVLENVETPGLGGRVAEPGFTEQFESGDGILATDAGAAPIVTMGGDPSADRYVEAITGATQTSMAMERILNHYLACFHRAMAARQATD